MRMTGKRIGLTTLLVALLVAGTTDAAVKAVITKTGTGQKLTGKVKWLATTKKYSIMPEGSPVEYKLDPSDVADIRVAKPAELDAAVKQVVAGRYASALPVLEKIMKDYTMLQYDVVAAQYLAQAYLKTKDPRKAVSMCDRVAGSNPQALENPGFAGIYWQGLLETEQYMKLDKALAVAIKGESRELAAVAQLRRGDIAKQKGNLDDALIDGYLRTVIFFQGIKTVQPEALYKAAKCFEEKGQHSYAEKMRKELLSSYPQSEYAQKVKSGA
ncbi:MAG: hypothetical protein ISS31_03835 [Kiritimatiellae bacterium]|nr:hypothetical protein [Kiritimatiellia bacterium]